MRHKWITALAALFCAAGVSYGATSVNLEFNGSGNTLEATGFDNAYRLDPTHFTVGGGALTITTQPGDIYGQYEPELDPDTAMNVFYSEIQPLYKTVLNAKITYNNLNNNFQGGGLWLGTDEDHYVRLGVVNVSPNIRTEFIRENVDLWNNPAGGYNGPGGDIQNIGGPNITTSPLTQPLTVWLRIVREGRSATGYYSLDGTNYTLIHTWNDVATGPTPDYPHIPSDATFKVGVYAFGDPGALGDATAAFDFFRAESFEADRPLKEITSANGYRWFLKPGIGDASWAATGLDERTDGTWTERTVPDPNWATGPVNPGTLAYGWYRIHFTTPPEMLSVPGRKVTLRIQPKAGEAIGDVDATYVNGTLVGTTGSFPFTNTVPGPNTNATDNKSNYYPGAAPVPFQQREYTFPASLLKSGADANVIAIKVYNRGGNGGLIGIPQLQVALPTASVSGTVTSNGTPVAEARVSAMDENGLVSQSVLTGADGKFSLPAVATGRTIIGMAKPGLLPATADLGALAENQSVTNVAISASAVSGGPAPVYDDFDDGPEGWRTKWDVVSLVHPDAAGTEGDPVNPTILEPGFDVNTFTPIPSSIMVTSGSGDRGGVLSKQRFSKYASVNAARLVSAQPFDAGGNIPNIILQLNGAEEDNVSKLPGYGSYKYIEFDIEGTVHALSETGADLGTRLRWIVWIQGTDPVRGVIPVNFAAPTDISPDKPLDLTIARTGSFYDFFVNGTRIHSFNTFDNGMPNHKIDLYSFPAFAQMTWGWVRAADASVAPPVDTAKAVKALRIAGGLEAASNTDVTNLNVAGGDNKITVQDAVTLLRTATGS